jgi:hypothetical protein
MKMKEIKIIKIDINQIFNKIIIIYHNKINIVDKILY